MSGGKTVASHYTLMIQTHTNDFIRHLYISQQTSCKMAVYSLYNLLLHINKKAEEKEEEEEGTLDAAALTESFRIRNNKGGWCKVGEQRR